MSKALRLTRALILLMSAAVVLAGCSSIHEPKISGVIDRGDNPDVANQIAYAKAHYKNPNTKEFGDLGGTDCVNFTSQTLLARGWSMTTGWASSTDASGHEYSRAWISSTGFRDYLKGHPELASPVTWEHKELVQPGDVVQFDWDASGDRDHTAIVSGISEDATTGERVILVSSHSPGAFDWPISDVLAEHGPQTEVYFWHIND